MRLMNEPGLRRRLSQSARRRATHEFGALTMGVRSLNAYQHVVDIHGEFGVGRQAAKHLHRRVSTIPEAFRNQHVTLAF